MAEIVVRMRRDPNTGQMVKVYGDAKPQNSTLDQLQRENQILRKHLVDQKDLQNEIKALKDKLKEQEWKNYRLAHENNQLRKSEQINAIVSPAVDKTKLIAALTAPESQQILAESRKEVNMIKDVKTGKWVEVHLKKDGTPGRIKRS